MSSIKSFSDFLNENEFTGYTFNDKQYNEFERLLKDVNYVELNIIGNNGKLIRNYKMGNKISSFLKKLGISNSTQEINHSGKTYHTIYDLNWNDKTMTRSIS